MATVNGMDLDWVYGKETEAKKSVRISLQLSLPWMSVVKMEIDRTFKDNSKFFKFG